MLTFFEKISEAINIAINYIVNICRTAVSLLTMVLQSDEILTTAVALLPPAIQVCAISVIAISIIKAIFGRIGSN